MNNSDLWVREGAYDSEDDPTATASFSTRLAFPRTQGADIVGRVAAAGDGVSSGGVYMNYLSEEGDEGADRVKAAYGSEKYRRLAALKNKYDPENLFRMNQNIPPSSERLCLERATERERRFSHKPHRPPHKRCALGSGVGQEGGSRKSGCREGLII